MKSWQGKAAAAKFLTKTLHLGAIAGLFFGCGHYGKLSPGPVSARQAPAFIKEHENEFLIYYSGPVNAPAALLLDRRDDGVRLTGEGWYPVDEQTRLNEMVNSLRANYRAWGLAAQGPQLTTIKDAQGTTLGYLYSALEYTPVIKEGPEAYRVFPVTDSEVRERANPGIKGAGG